MNPANFLAYAAQVTIVVLACAGLPRLLGLRAPGVQYAFWRTVLVVCLLLPVVQPWQPHEMIFVPAPNQGPPRLPPPSFAAPPPAAASGFDWVAAAQIVIPLGIAARLAWIGIGMIRLRRMRRRATEAAFGFGDLQQTIGVTAPILWSAEVRHPVTFGVFDRVVLLPVALKTVDVAAQRAVVAHELNHVKRGDWGWVVAEEVVRSVFWFHPAVWWLVSRVQLARETVVDELSILVTNARRTYLDTLLAFADDTGLASPPAFSARRHLFHRVMLLSQEGHMSSSRVAVASCVLMLALGAGTWEAVKAFPLYGAAQEQKPPRDPMSAALYHRLAVEYFEKARQDTTLTPDAKRQVILKGIAAEDRALALNPDYIDALAFKNILLRMQAILTDDPQVMNDLIRQADELRTKALTLQAAGVRPLAGDAPPPPPPPPPSRGVPGGVPRGVSGGVIGGIPSRGDDSLASPEWVAFQALVDQYKPIRIGGSVRAPTKTRDVKPEYPPLAQSARVQGVVIVEVLIDSDGKVVDGRILRSIPLLDQAAMAAVRQWEFVPTLLNGSPVAVLMTVTTNFSLE